ncbi:MAG: Ig-like domain-containing protein [Anaerolineae bacterium]
MQKHTLNYHVVAMILVLAVLSGACQLSWSAPPDVITPTSEPTSVQPTPTPNKWEALPLPAPKLLDRTPEPGARQPPEAPLQLVFDQPMDKASVESAFSVKPQVEGEFVWRDARTLTFRPAERLKRGARYRVVVAESARNAEGTSLVEPVTFEFETEGFLEVSQVQPAPDSEGLDPQTNVTVVFNRPVVPLTAVSAQEDLPDPLRFSPPLEGEGEWLNTSIYVFRPAKGLQPATAYEARVVAGLTDTVGGVLEEDYVWTFSTVRPDIVALSPEPNFSYVGPTDVISVTFNQPMDHAATEAAFSLQIDGAPVAGTFSWSGGATSWAPETLRFTPVSPLPRGARGEITVEATAQAASGEFTLGKTFTRYFSTVAEPAFLRAGPADLSDVLPYDAISLWFASPMDCDRLPDYLQITPTITEVITSCQNHNTRVGLHFDKEPRTTYRLTLDAETPDAYGVPLGEPVEVTFTVGDFPPQAYLDTIGNIGFYTPFTDTVVYAQVRNVSRLDLRLYALTPEAFMRLTGYGVSVEELGRGMELLRAWSQPLDLAPNVGAAYRVPLEEEDALPPGLYVLEMEAPETLAEYPDRSPESFLFVKSGVNLTLKQTQNESLVWATDLATGEPIANLDVRFYSEAQDWHGEGATDVQGLLAQDVETVDLWAGYFAFAGEPGDPTFAVAFNRWTNGISAWDFNVQPTYGDQNYRTALYTDRPIYRPDQTVYFKGIVRTDDDAHYTLPDFETVDVTVSDPQGETIYEETLPLNEMGTAHGELALSPEAALGFYTLSFYHGDDDFLGSTNFQVAEYRKPEYEVRVTTDREAYLNGETIDATAEAEYYFGGPVADADVRWNVLREGYFFEYDCPAGQVCPRYSWTDVEDSWSMLRGEDVYAGYGELIEESDTTTDAQGRTHVSVQADIATETRSQRYTLEASVTDINGQQVSNRTAVIVHQGAFYIGLAPQGRLAQVGERKTVDVLTVDWESRPVADVPIDVVVYKLDWYNVRERAENGRYYWTWTREETPVYTTTVTTDDAGRAIVGFTPEEAGSYRVRAFGRDAQENEIRSSTYVWVWGGEAIWRRENNNRVDLVPDRDSYAVGDVAEILVPSPFSGTMQALITIERGHVIETEVREITGSSELLRIPIEEAHVPNIFVSVVLVQGAEVAGDGLPRFKMGLVKLNVDDQIKRLNVTLTPDRDMAAGETYRPREEVTYDVRVTDAEGNPVEAELSLRLADLAVLALADEQSPSLMETFWVERGLSVRTSMPLVVYMEPYNRDLAVGAKGGGGGGGAMEPGTVRSNFADTAFWDPVVRTDADGRAQVTVTLPDNLTTWRMQARAVTAETRVGRADVDVRSTLDLLVRPVLPRFLVEGDRAEIATIVHNNTDEALTAEVSVALDGLSLEGEPRQTVEVPAGDQVKVVWPVTVRAGVEEARVQMEAQAGDLRDAREDRLPVHRYSTPEVVATAGQLSEAGLRQELIQLPGTFDATQGGLTVQLDGSLTAATRDALIYLEHYPYECTEQTVSRFLPNALTYQALEEMGLDRPELRENLASLITLALQRLYNRQHYDGGWGWWSSDRSDGYITAYVIHGLLEAHRAGFTVSERALGDGVDYLQEALPSVDADTSAWKANRLAYQLYVLSDHALLFEDGENTAGILNRAVQLYGRREKLDRYGQALLALALHLMDAEGQASRVQTLLDDLWGDAVLSATGTHWEEDAVDYYNMGADVRTTATVLWAASRIEPESQQLANVVRWLMAVREGDGYWESTHTTSWSLLGLIAYMQASGELEGDFAYNVYLNGAPWESGAFTAATIDESHTLQREIAALLTDRANRLIIERLPGDDEHSGEGQLYYTAQLRYFLPAAEVEALDRGIIVARQYTPVDGEGTVTEAEVGDVLRVKLTLIAPTDLHYVVVEDPLPAGCEGVDLSLKTTSVVGERPELRNLTLEERDRWYRWYGWGWWWFSHSEMRDEKMTLFATYLPRGTYEYTYLIRAGVPGDYNVMPTTAYEMYFPEVFGRSEGLAFTVESAD